MHELRAPKRCEGAPNCSAQYVPKLLKMLILAQIKQELRILRNGIYYEW